MVAYIQVCELDECFMLSVVVYQGLIELPVDVHLVVLLVRALGGSQP